MTRLLFGLNSPRVRLALVAAAMVVMLPGLAAAQDCSDAVNKFYSVTVRVFAMGNPMCTEDDPFLCMPPIGHGSGLGFYAEEGVRRQVYVLTNAHVVSGAVAVAVEFPAVEEKLAAVTVYEFPDADVALLRVSLPPERQIEDLRVGEYRSLQFMNLNENREYLTNPQAAPIGLGSTVCLLGYPIDPTQRSPGLKQGVFSRWFENPQRKLWLETEASVNQGNSGGPAFDKNGRILGLVVARAGQAQGISYVVPAGTVKAVMEQGFKQMVPAMTLTTNVEPAYAALAKAAAFFLETFYYQERNDDARLRQATQNAGNFLTQAISADPGYADAYLFTSWLAWYRFCLLAAALAGVDESQAQSVEAQQVLAAVNQEMATMLQSAYEMAVVAVQLNPNYIREGHPAAAYVALVYTVYQKLLGEESGGGGCQGMECGYDSKGNSCGSCASGYKCSNGQCVPDCTPSCYGKACGDDGCGGSCGSCPHGQTCSYGQCVASGSGCTCAGKECGDDGCGNTCGYCGEGEYCDYSTCRSYGKPLKFSMGFGLEAALNSQDKDLGAADAALYVGLSDLSLGLEYYRTYSPFQHGKEVFLHDYVAFDAGYRFDLEDWKLGVKAGYLGMGESGAAGPYGTISLSGDFISIRSTHYYVTMADDLVGIEEDELGHAFMPDIWDEEVWGATPWAVLAGRDNYQTVNQVTLAFEDAFALVADFHYKEWYPVKQVGGSGCLRFDVSPGSDWYFGVGRDKLSTDKDPHINAEKDEVSFTEWIAGLTIGGKGFGLDFRYQYNNGDGAPSEHVFVTGLNVSLTK